MDDNCCRANKNKDKKLGEVIEVMSEIRTAEDAIEKAELFLMKYYPFRKLQSVRGAENSWIVRFDVAVIGPKIVVSITLDKYTGEVVEYTSAE